MPERIVDLRSDTVTKPSPEMREVIARAEVGDDVLGDDPTVMRLERKMIDLLGKEAAVYVPSGTMANLLALLSQTKPGDEVIVDRNCHIFNYEAAGASAVGGLQLHPLDGPDGFLPLEAVPGAMRPENIHHPRTSLIAVENTHNRGSGRVYPYDQLEKVYRIARGNGLRVHLDGARLANAVVASGVPFAKYGAIADSINICFSKGLGAPVGSILISDPETIKKARFWRKRLGGGMRQAGILAAACLYAIENNVDRLKLDHAKASRIASAIGAKKGPEADLPGRDEHRDIQGRGRVDRFRKIHVRARRGRHTGARVREKIGAHGHTPGHNGRRHRLLRKEVVTDLLI